MCNFNPSIVSPQEHQKKIIFSSLATLTSAKKAPREMEGSFTSSTPTQSQHFQKSGETNENDQMGSSKLQNPKKAAMKHFMSPTISAATKAAAVPRKKILAERNEAFTFTDPQSQKPQILDSKTIPIISGTGRSVRSSYNSAYETHDDDEEHNTSDADSSLKKPYDPLTNYLSPRPKFLRYNPNRRHKIFLHGENEATERKDGFGGIKTSVSFDSQKAVGEETPSEEEVSVKEDDERMDKNEGNHNDDEEEMEEVEEIEEFEEETCWSLTGVLKFLLVLGALFLSTSYICSMNSPNPSPIQEAIWDFRHGFQKIQTNIYEVVTSNKFFEGGNQVVIDGRGEETLMGLLAVNQRDMDDGFVEEEMVEEDDVDRGLVESTVGLGEVVEVQNEQCENVFNDGWVNKLKVPDPMPGSETAASEVLCDGEVVAEVEGSSSQLWGSDFISNEGVSDQEMDKIRESSDQLQGFETAEKSESFQAAPNALENEAASIDLKFKDEQMESEEQIKSQKVTAGEGKEVVENEMEIAEDLMLVLVKGEMLEVVPLVAFITIVTALGFVYRSRQKKSDIKEDYLPTALRLDESVAAAAEKISPVVCNVEKKLEKVESFASPSSSSIRSTKEASEEFSWHSQAPIVELLGELVIGEASSSLRNSHGMRRKVLDFEEGNRNSVSTEMMISRSKAPSVQIQGQPSQMEISNADSPSFGSFRAEKKTVVKKEEGKGEEASKVITTPVRRSSRIRNRAMSP